MHASDVPIDQGDSDVEECDGMLDGMLQRLSTQSREQGLTLQRVDGPRRHDSGMSRGYGSYRVARRTSGAQVDHAEQFQLSTVNGMTTWRCGRVVLDIGDVVGQDCTAHRRRSEYFIISKELVAIIGRPIAAKMATKRGI